jgi:beta-galactosidase
MVYIASEWRENSSTNIRVFSNADEVELSLNGAVISKNKPSTDKLSTHLPHPPFEFTVKAFSAGKLTAKAYIDGEMVAQHYVETPGKAVAIKLTLDTSGKALATGVNDVAFIYAELIDDNGNLVPLNGEQIAFKSQGDIEILNPEIPLTEQGKAAVLVRIGASLTNSSITANAAKLNLISRVFALNQDKPTQVNDDVLALQKEADLEVAH